MHLSSKCKRRNKSDAYKKPNLQLGRSSSAKIIKYSNNVNNNKICLIASVRQISDVRLLNSLATEKIPFIPKTPSRSFEPIACCEKDVL